METKLKLPHELITICKVRENELEAFLKRAIAIELFREGLVSIGKASEIAEVSRNEMMDLLGERRIPLHYTVEDLEEDIKTLRRIEQG
jgi:predicted HTH domain antitoxin